MSSDGSDRDEDREVFARWYDENREQYEKLTELARHEIESLVKRMDIPHLAIRARTKTKASFLVKALNCRDEGKDPREIRDISAVRAIAYTESDRKRIVELIEKNLTIVKAPLWPDQRLDPDQAGYRGVNIGCKLRQEQEQKPFFAETAFEVQVHTALENAWAEITHKREYKFGGKLRPDLLRRVHVASMALEMVDAEFDRLANEIDAYAAEVRQKARQPGEDLTAVAIDSTSLKPFLDAHLAGWPRMPRMNDDQKAVVGTIQELGDFGVRTLHDLRGLLKEELFTDLQRFSTVVGMLRAAMMLTDLDRYFESAWNGHWTHWWPHTYRIIADRYGGPEVHKWIARHKMTTGPVNSSATS